MAPQTKMPIVVAGVILLLLGGFYFYKQEHAGTSAVSQTNSQTEMVKSSQWLSKGEGGLYLMESGPDGDLYYDPEYKISFRLPESYIVAPYLFEYRTLADLKRSLMEEKNGQCTRIAYIAVADMSYTRYRGPGIDINVCFHGQAYSESDLISKHEEYVSFGAIVENVEIGGKTFIQTYQPKTESKYLAVYHNKLLYSISIEDEHIDAKRLWSIINTIRFD